MRARVAVDARPGPPAADGAQRHRRERRDVQRRDLRLRAAAEAETERLRSELQAKLRAKGAAELQADGVKWW